MQTNKDCYGCKHLTRREHWTPSGKCQAGYCLLHDDVVRKIKMCEAKKLRMDRKEAEEMAEESVKRQSKAGMFSTVAEITANIYRAGYAAGLEDKSGVCFRRACTAFCAVCLQSGACPYPDKEMCEELKKFADLMEG